jgi:3-oxoacyl-[acyl-carrier-protein] synthase-3
MPNVGIIGTGSYVPERILKNRDLEKMVNTSDKWIIDRTGIRERRIAADDETNVTMGRIALERAMDNARIAPEAIEMLVVGTNTRKYPFP